MHAKYDTSNREIMQNVLYGRNSAACAENVDISLLEGDFTIIMGSSGSGKSTLLYALSGMDKPSLGEVHFIGKISPS